MLRKICNHPDLTTPAGSLWKLRKDEAQQENTAECREKNDSEYGHWRRAGKLIVVHSLLKLWKKQKHKVLLFTQTRQVSDDVMDSDYVIDSDVINSRVNQTEINLNIICISTDVENSRNFCEISRLYLLQNGWVNVNLIPATFDREIQ